MEVQLSCGEAVTITANCEPQPVVIRSSEGTDPVVDLFTATDGMYCPGVGVKRNHADEFPVSVFNVGYMGPTDDGFDVMVLTNEFPDIKVHVRVDRGSGGSVDMPEEFSILDFRGNNFYIHLDSVLAGFTATQLKAAMTPAMRTALAAILP